MFELVIFVVWTISLIVTSLIGVGHGWKVGKEQGEQEMMESVKSLFERGLVAFTPEGQEAYEAIINKSPKQ